MKQSRAASLFDAVGGTAVGFVVALIVQLTIFPWMFGFKPPIHQDLAMIGVFTFASIVRGFLWRRFCEWMHVRVRMSPFVQAVLAELQRQKTVEGWDAAHDDAHSPGTLALAGAAYLIGPERQTYTDYEHDQEIDVVLSGRTIWPFALDWLKWRETRRNLIRGVALGIAEGERHDRMRNRKRGRG